MRITASVGALVVAAVLATGFVSASQKTASDGAPLVASVEAGGLDLSGFAVAPLPSPTPLATPTPVAPKGPAPVKAKPPAPPALVVVSTQQRLINQDRARYGLAPLTWSSCLSSVARYEAGHLASPGVAFRHYDGVNRDLACHLGRQVGENIGWWSGGVNDSQINSMFMASSDHKANILGPYRYVATAWAVAANGYGYIAVEFG